MGRNLSSTSPLHLRHQDYGALHFGLLQHRHNLFHTKLLLHGKSLTHSPGRFLPKY